MKRMQCLRLMPSHTYFYKKLSQFGKDHDKPILDVVEKEGKRLTACGKVLQLQKEQEEEREEEEQSSSQIIQDKTNVRNGKLHDKL